MRQTTVRSLQKMTRFLHVFYRLVMTVTLLFLIKMLYKRGNLVKFSNANVMLADVFK